MDDNLRAQLEFEARKKSVGASYLLWFFLGGFGAHRFYLGRKGSAIAQLLLGLLGWIPVGLGWLVLGIWWIVDAFLIPGIAEEENMKSLNQLTGTSRMSGPDEMPHRLDRKSNDPRLDHPMFEQNRRR